MISTSTKSVIIFSLKNMISIMKTMMMKAQNFTQMIL